MPNTVAFLYAKDLDTGQFSKDYEVIELGQIPFSPMPLEMLPEALMLGVRASGRETTIVRKPFKNKINGEPAISWIYEWHSKTGYIIVEYITFVATSSGTRSLAVRTTKRDYKDRMKFYDSVLDTFQSFDRRGAEDKKPLTKFSRPRKASDTSE